MYAYRCHMAQNISTDDFLCKTTAKSTKNYKKCRINLKLFDNY